MAVQVITLDGCEYYSLKDIADECGKSKTQRSYVMKRSGDIQTRFINRFVFADKKNADRFRELLTAPYEPPKGFILWQNAIKDLGWPNNEFTRERARALGADVSKRMCHSYCQEREWFDFWCIPEADIDKLREFKPFQRVKESDKELKALVPDEFITIAELNRQFERKLKPSVFINAEVPMEKVYSENRGKYVFCIKSENVNKLIDYLNRPKTQKIKVKAKKNKTVKEKSNLYNRFYKLSVFNFDYEMYEVKAVCLSYQEAKQIYTSLVTMGFCSRFTKQLSAKYRG